MFGKEKKQEKEKEQKRKAELAALTDRIASLERRVEVAEARASSLHITPEGFEMITDIVMTKSLELTQAVLFKRMADRNAKELELKEQEPVVSEGG